MKTILKKPVITEKATALNESGKYAFIVDRNANKIEIRKAVEQMYGVSVVSVNTMRYQGKAKSRYTKAQVVQGRKPAFKKAVVQLAEGDLIDIYDI